MKLDYLFSSYHSLKKEKEMEYDWIDVGLLALLIFIALVLIMLFLREPVLRWLLRRRIEELRTEIWGRLIQLSVSKNRDVVAVAAEMSAEFDEIKIYPHSLEDLKGAYGELSEFLKDVKAIEKDARRYAEEPVK